MKIAILGAGNGGCATAVDLGLKGFEVSLCSAYRPDHFKPIIKKKGLSYSGVLGEGFVKIEASTSIKKTIKKANIIILTAPSDIHEYYTKLLAPSLCTEHLIFISGCTTGGALHVVKILKESGVKNPRVCETNILPYICRLQTNSHIKILHKMRWGLFGCFPSKYNSESYEVMRDIYPELEVSENLFETGLSNLNAIIHPPGMILNVGWIEFMKGNFYFYSQGVTPLIAHIIETVDNERLNLLRKLSLREISFIEHLYKIGISNRSKGSIYEILQESKPLKFISSPTNLEHRFLLEDVSYGLVPMASIAREINSPTPTIDSIIYFASLLNNIDHWKRGLTTEKLGIAGIGLEKILQYLYEGSYEVS